MDFDITWENPTEAQNAALEHAMKYAQPFLARMQSHHDWEYGTPINEFNIAEMMCIAENSLWYTQAKMWAEGQSFPAKGADQVFQMAGRAIVKLVELGYSDGVWWDARQIWEKPAAIALNLASIIEVVRLLRQIRARSLAINSQWFEALPYLMIPGVKVEHTMKKLETPDGAKLVVASIMAQFDPEFAKKLRQAHAEVAKKFSQEYEPTECIHPECHNLVAPPKVKPREGHFKNYRSTGACQRGHNSYFCTKCQKPHNFASKIGKEHYEKWYGKDWDGTDMEGEKWTF